MGFRFRKSINLGIFRINLSKTGIGYSVGIPGFRQTKLANGRSRRTFSIPGTGISHVTETTTNKKTKRFSLKEQKHNTFRHPILQDKKEELLKILYKYKYLQILLVLLSILSILIYFLGSTYALFLALYFLSISIWLRIHKRILFNIPTTKLSLLQLQFFNQVLEVIEKSKSIFEAPQEDAEAFQKEGSCTPKRKIRIHKKRLPLILSPQRYTNVKIGRTKLIFLPCGILVEQTFTIRLLPTKDISVFLTTANVLEPKTPKDSQCVGHTWKYINTDGSPDKKVKHNPVLNINKYGVVILRISNDLKLKILFSDYYKIPVLREIIGTMNIHQQ